MKRLEKALRMRWRQVSIPKRSRIGRLERGVLTNAQIGRSRNMPTGTSTAADASQEERHCADGVLELVRQHDRPAV